MGLAVVKDGGMSCLAPTGEATTDLPVVDVWVAAATGKGRVVSAYHVAKAQGASLCPAQSLTLLINEAARVAYCAVASGPCGPPVFFLQLPGDAVDMRPGDSLNLRPASGAGA